MLLPEDTVAGPFSGLSEAAIKSQLDKIVASRHFRASKKYPAFLRFVVESALSSESASLKERTVGIEVFHRAADYDSNADPVVRITAGEVRKRLAQYYGGHQWMKFLSRCQWERTCPGSACGTQHLVEKRHQRARRIWNL